MTSIAQGPDDPRRAVPIGERPTFPEGYGLPVTTDGMLAWAQVREKLVGAHNYWLATVRPDGRPHVIPRWGVWLHDRFYYDGAPTTIHVRNLTRNPECALHLESGTESVIVEGTSRATMAEAAGLGRELAEAFGKYHLAGYQPGADSWAGEAGGGLRVLTPHRAMAWFAFPTDATRFRFG